MAQQFDRKAEAGPDQERRLVFGLVLQLAQGAAHQAEAEPGQGQLSEFDWESQSELAAAQQLAR
ncbi:hypothetical protein [Ruegeria conchae]|uniref:hypothetical protein n=1 Tax=Ruegeria conchae TaxID=981384 RepID=UPI0002378B77|nr:hypothetical protein [Ruegeria conchae]